MPAKCLKIASHAVEGTPNGVDVREHRAGRTDDHKRPEKFAGRNKRPYGHRNHRVGQRRWHDGLDFVRLTCAVQPRAAESRTRSGPDRVQSVLLRRRGTGNRFSTAVSREFTASNIARISAERPASACLFAASPSPRSSNRAITSSCRTRASRRESSMRADSVAITRSRRSMRSGNPSSAVIRSSRALSLSSTRSAAAIVAVLFRGPQPLGRRCHRPA